MLMPDYQVAGSGETTIYLLHGAYGSKDYWQYEIKLLVEQGYRVVAWDAPGYGISPLPAQYSIRFLAQSFVKLLYATCSKRNILFGHSMGGIIAPMVYALAPEKINALVISATVESLGHLSKEFQDNFIRERIAPLNAGVALADAAAPLINAMMGPKSTGALVEKVKQVALSTPIDTFKAAIRAIVEYDGRGAVAKIKVPTLCIAGEFDPIGKVDIMAEMASKIDSSTFTVIDGTAHYAWAEQPEVFNQKLFAFLRLALKQ
ncbi:alpha/beta fold hydrolase [Rheinheimera salexigens]|uniref:AB hydrolase-1 domain-containing protein n=1 Tax=Rheinheimera salexigens TaxID=1628148 RepID=A0A1E7Q3E4_9GAMM|nr:alpha/beta hydrolase [Rheinheimera salexigens]OEY68651.1 hypothetical protein BI198_02980 [Rheinheimera salexigens]